MRVTGPSQMTPSPAETALGRASLIKRMSLFGMFILIIFLIINGVNLTRDNKTAVDQTNRSIAAANEGLATANRSIDALDRTLKGIEEELDRERGRSIQLQNQNTQLQNQNYALIRLLRQNNISVASISRVVGASTVRNFETKTVSPKPTKSQPSARQPSRSPRPVINLPGNSDKSPNADKKRERFSCTIIKSTRCK